MTFQASSDSPVFVDWLDFTLPEVMGCIPDFRAFLESFGFAGQQDDRSWIYRVPESSGVVRLTSGIRGVDRVSLSGSALAYLRSQPSGWNDLIHWLSERPHRVTRLDAALDFQVDAPAELQRFRRRVSQLGGRLALSRFSSPVSWLLGRNDLGQETGTMYVGKRGKNQVLARVYDKAHEVSQRTGDIIPPTLRFEIEVKGTSGKARNPCLNDVYDPRSIFWEFASPALLERPSGVPEWSPVDFQTFTLEQVHSDPLERVIAFIERSEFFPSLVRVASGLDNPRDDLSRLVAHELSKALRRGAASQSAAAD